MIFIMNNLYPRCQVLRQNYVCVCVYKRERERERECKQLLRHPFFPCKTTTLHNVILRKHDSMVAEYYFVSITKFCEILSGGG